MKQKPTVDLTPSRSKGAEASAWLYSLIETAKANGPVLYKYLHYLFKHSLLVDSDDEYEKLLPSKPRQD